jgi:RimJ/RimL family protein N-acetyltransferase
MAVFNPANRPSIRVLEKCGFQVVRHLPTVDRYEYRLDRPPGRALAARP